MILNQFDTRVIICKGEFANITTPQTTIKEYTSYVPAITENLEVITPNGLNRSTTIIENFNPSDLKKGFIEKIMDCKYIKRYDAQSGSYEFIVVFEDFTSPRYEYDLYDISIRVNGVHIESKYVFLDVGADQKISALISVARNLVRELNEVELIFSHKTDNANAYGWVYEIEDYTDEQLMSVGANDIYDFKTSDAFNNARSASTFSLVNNQTTVNKYKDISFTEDHSDISIYDNIGDVGGNERYMIVRISETEDMIQIERYVDCILESKRTSFADDVNKFFYEFTGRMI